MKRFINTIFIFFVISGYGSPGDKINASTHCLAAKSECEGSCAGKRNTASCKSCCKVTYYNCLDPEGKKTAGGPEYLATHEAACGMQCENIQEDEWNKVVFMWGAFDQTRNPFANKPPSLSHAENCLATAYSQCVSTRTFPLLGARCCIAKSCELLAAEVLARETEKCASNPLRGCQDTAKETSKNVLMQCQGTYRPCRSSPTP